MTALDDLLDDQNLAGFYAVADEYGVMAIGCPACQWQLDESRISQFTIGTMIAAAREHMADAHRLPMHPREAT